MNNQNFSDALLLIFVVFAVIALHWRFVCKPMNASNKPEPTVWQRFIKWIKGD